MKEKTYLIEGLDCANCAAKIENKISNMQGIKSASVDFTTRKLRVKTEENNQLFDEIATEIKKIEPEATLIDPDKTASIVSHEHSRECGCKISNNGHVFNRVYDIRNLCCEICASEIEKKLLDIDSVTSASVAFTTGKIFITSTVDPDTFLEKIQKACNSVHHDISLKEHSHGDHNKNNNLTEFWVGTIIFIIAFIVSHIFLLNINKAESSYPLQIWILLCRLYFNSRLSSPALTSSIIRSYCPLRYRYPIRASKPVALL